jgi:hypothetical protein
MSDGMGIYHDMKLDFWAGNSACPEKFPTEISGNFLPNNVVPIQLVFGLEQRKTW